MPKEGSPVQFFVEIDLTFTGDSEDALGAIGVAVTGSDPALTGGGFSRFGFVMDPVDLSGWLEFAPINLAGEEVLLSSVPGAPPVGTDLPPGPYHVGTLSIDLSGLPMGLPLHVTLADSTAAATLADGSVEDALVEFAAPNGDTVHVANPIPEPLSLSCSCIGVAALGNYLRKRRTWQ